MFTDNLERSHVSEQVLTPSMLQFPHIFDKYRCPDSSSAVSDLDKKIEWSPNLKDAVTKAQESGKPLVIVFEESNCGWCKRFDDELNKPPAADLGDRAIFVRANPATDPQARAMAESLGITAYPTVSILNVDGTNVTERTRITGYMTAGDFAARFKMGETQLA